MMMMMMIFAVSTATDPPSPAAIQSELIPAVASLFTPNWLRTSDGDFLAGEILLKTIGFERPGGREWLPSGTPFQKFYTFFGRVFGRARVQISNVPLLRSVFFCNVKKVRSKDPIGYAAWGLPQGPAFACTLTILNKTKKQKQKKTQVLFGILISNKHFCARRENTK